MLPKMPAPAEQVTANTRQARETITVVIPALNEQDGITATIEAIPKQQLEEMGLEVQLLVVDNGSTDGTPGLAMKAGADVIVEPRRGYGSAFKTGFAGARGTIIATCDADGTYPVEELPRLVKTLLEEKLDFLTTNRLSGMDRGAMSLRNQIGNTILAWETRILYGLNLRDPESGMWVFRKEILPALRLRSDTWPFSHELKLEACFYARRRCREVPIHYGVRLGQTNLSAGWKVGFDDFVHILKKRFIR